MNNDLSIRWQNPLVQTVSVAFISAVLVLAADKNDFRSPANLFWMVALPALLGVLLNTGWVRKGIMTGSLVMVSMVSAIAVGVNVTSYG